MIKYAMTLNTSLLQTAQSLLDDARIYLEKITPGAYSLPIPFLSGSTIGQHTRHIIEFFQCLIEQVESPSDWLNYDLRRRDHSLETVPQQALDAIDAIDDMLPNLEAAEWLVLQTSDYQDDEPVIIPTSSDRELFYVIEHTIHHFALVRAGLTYVAPDLELPDHFGVAPSTLRYRGK